MNLRTLAAAVLVVLLFLSTPASAQQRRPNVIFILADDLGIGDIGPYGQKKIKTPHLDRMAAEGIRFTQAYCGTSVCAPSRVSLMTGLHMGHAPIRANREIRPEGQVPLPAGTYTMPRMFKDAGYATMASGKWGLGWWESSGDPLKVGVDHFFGYNCQRHAHSYFPAYLYDDDKRIELDGKTYAQELIAADTLKWVRANRDKPFFLYFALTLPHGKFEIDTVGDYAKEDWPAGAKTYAAMVSRMDADIGRLMSLLKELNIDDHTLVIFTSDNGVADRPGGVPADFFDGNLHYRGVKRSMYEGGLRTPMIARWPGVVPAGKASDELVAFWDFLPTFAEVAGAKLPETPKLDGLSAAAALKGGPMPPREYLYWELHEGRPKQAIRFGDHKAVRNGPSLPLEIYNLEDDPSERIDLAGTTPGLVDKAEQLIKAARTENDLFPWKEPRPRPAQTRSAQTRPARPNAAGAR